MFNVDFWLFLNFFNKILYGFVYEISLLINKGKNVSKFKIKIFFGEIKEIGLKLNVS